ncbi:MAG: FkbM family methyltransferase [Saprospirales bacterium]|nr:FkbM family methyltransferase [Saprospirales bacterium]
MKLYFIRCILKDVKVDFIKMDVEGYERSILEASQLYNRNKLSFLFARIITMKTMIYYNNY